MAHEVGQTDKIAETQLALARFHLNQLANPRDVAQQLSKQTSGSSLAELCLAMGDRKRAKKFALAAYKWAWADGEPYVNRYGLNKACGLLKELGVAIPDLPKYDPEKEEKFPWEDKVVAVIAKLKAENEAKKAKEAESEKES